MQRGKEDSVAQRFDRPKTVSGKRARAILAPLRQLVKDETALVGNTRFRAICLLSYLEGYIDAPMLRKVSGIMPQLPGNAQPEAIPDDQPAQIDVAELLGSFEPENPAS